MKRTDIVIGASEAAAALDLDEWQTPVEFYARKLGLIDDDDGDESEAAWLGTHIEHSLATAFAERNDVVVCRSPSLRSYSQPWLRATPDRLIFPKGMSESFRRRFHVEPDEVVPVEFKTTGLASYKSPRDLAEVWGAPMSDVVPQRFVVQTLMQGHVVTEHAFDQQIWERSPLHPMLEIANRPLVVRRVILVALLPSRGLVDYVIPVDDRAVVPIVGALTGFVDGHLVPELPPTPQSAADWRILGNAATRKHNGSKTVRKIEDEQDPVSGIVGAYLRAKAAEEAAEKEKQEMRARLISIIGDGYAVETPMGKALLTAPTEASTPRLLTRAFSDAVIEKLTEAAIVAPSPIVDELLSLVEKHTKSHTAGRTLRVTARK